MFRAVEPTTEPAPTTPEAAPAPASTATATEPLPSPRPRRPWWSLFAPALVGVTVGSMLGGSALGVMQAHATPRPRHRAHAAVPAVVAGGHAVEQETEANPEADGDGVMDDLNDGPAPTPQRRRVNLAAAAAALTAPAPTRVEPARPTPAPAGGPRVITSDNVPEGPAQGFVHGRPLRINVTRMQNKPIEVHTAAAFRRMYEAAAHDHVALRIVSGFRTMEHQQALYAAYRRGRGNLAARPGHSNHQSGHALDLNTSTPGVYRWLQRNAARFGFRRTVPTEAWHWEWW